MTLSESAMTEQLDRDELLAASHGPGCYALRVDVPTTAHAAREQWTAVHDADPPRNALERLAAADRTAYVGASGDVYARLCDHANGEVRKAAFLEAFDAEEVIDVWPHDNPFEAEWMRARKMTRRGWVSWCNGGVVG